MLRTLLLYQVKKKKNVAYCFQLNVQLSFRKLHNNDGLFLFLKLTRKGKRKKK